MIQKYYITASYANKTIYTRELKNQVCTETPYLYYEPHEPLPKRPYLITDSFFHWLLFLILSFTHKTKIVHRKIKRNLYPLNHQLGDDR